MTQNLQPRSPGAPASGPGVLPEIVLARSMAPSDNSTSIVIASPAGPQVQAGAVGVTAHADVVYATREDAEGRDLPLRLDLLVPDTPGAKPLVVYLPGGGFVFSAKETAPGGPVPARTRRAVRPRHLEGRTLGRIGGRGRTTRLVDCPSLTVAPVGTVAPNQSDQGHMYRDMDSGRCHRTERSRRLRPLTLRIHYQIKRIKITSGGSYVEQSHIS